MKKEKIQLDKFVPGGQTIGSLSDDKKVFVWGGLPNEEVEIEITKSKKSYAEGVVTNVLHSNPRRIKAKDECYLSTSPWQIMDYEYELEQKKELVKESFNQAGLLLQIDTKQAVTINKVATDDVEYNYRNKMEYSLYWNNNSNKVELAFHKRSSHQKIAVSDSSIERPEILQEAKNIIDDINARGLEARQFSSLMIRSNQNAEVRSMLFEKNKPHIQGKLLTDTIMGHEYTYSPNGFFQINLPVYEIALQQMKNYVANGKVLELYAGVGTIGLSVAKDNALTMVECDSNAYKELANNAKGFNNPSIKTVKAKSEDVLEYLTNDINTLILDPPRAGLHQNVVNKILESKPKNIIYLSCNPSTQARDVAMLSDEYKIDIIQPYNFFPRTPHIENLVVLSLM